MLAAAGDVAGGAGSARARSRAKVTDDLGGRGIFGVELFVKGDDVWFCEVSPRPHDTGMVTMCHPAQNEFELHARAILGLPVDTSLRAPGRVRGDLRRHGGAKGIAFEGVAEALRVPESDIRLFGKPESFSKRRMGVALATGRGHRRGARAREGCAARVQPRRVMLALGTSSSRGPERLARRHVQRLSHQRSYANGVEPLSTPATPRAYPAGRRRARRRGGRRWPRNAPAFDVASVPRERTAERACGWSRWTWTRR